MRGEIIVGYIFGTEAQAALERAIVEAQKHSARLVVVHSGKGGLEETDEEVLAYSNALARIDDDLNSAGIDHEVQEFVLGHEPADDLVRIARETRRGHDRHRTASANTSREVPSRVHRSRRAPRSRLSGVSGEAVAATPLQSFSLVSCATVLPDHDRTSVLRVVIAAASASSASTVICQLRQASVMLCP